MDLFDVISDNSETPMADLLNGIRKPMNKMERRWLLYHRKLPYVFEMFSDL